MSNGNVPAGTGSFRDFVNGVMKQKEIDHVASHSNTINQVLHLISSSIFLYCYVIFFNPNTYREAVYLGIASLVLRQSGHYIFEPPCHEKEQAMLGFDTQNKVKIVIFYFVLPTLFLAALSYQGEWLGEYVTVADLWIAATCMVVFGRVALLWYRFGFVVSQHWFIKFITDPFTDIPAYWRSAYQVVQPKIFKYALHRSFPNYVAIPANMTEEEIHALEHSNGAIFGDAAASEAAAKKAEV